MILIVVLCGTKLEHYSLQNYLTWKVEAMQRMQGRANQGGGWLKDIIQHYL